MPAKSSWLLRIPNIVATLSEMQAPVVDRGTFERLFRVRRRRAVDLVQRFGGYRVGNTVLVDRQKLIRQLQELETDPEVIREQRRKQRIADELDHIHRYSKAAAVVISGLPPVPFGAGWALPNGVSILDGRLSVEFSGVEELLTRLYGLAQAAAADFDCFCETLGCPSNAPSPAKSALQAHLAPDYRR